MTSLLHQLNDSKDLCIFECTASMYVESSKKWAEGKFFISPDGICFECGEEHRAATGFHSICVDFDEISFLQKETSSYIFPSITCMVDKQKYWFGSFANRDAVFNMLEHFWRECLFMTSKAKSLDDTGSDTACSSESRLGKDLLKIVYDSEKTLSQSAASLSRQGKQLDNALSIAEDIRSDLEVADKKLSLIESWLGVSLFAATPKQKPKTDGVSMDYPAIFYKHGASLKQKDNYLQGTFQITPDGLTLISSKEVVFHQFNKKEISTIYLISPWEIKIEQRRFGAQDICLTVITAKLVVAFTFLQRYFGELIEMPHRGRPQRYRTRSNVDQKLDYYNSEQMAAGAAEKLSGAAACIEAAQEQKLVSDAEAKELRQVLHAMKTLALEINKEQDNQMHKIDELMASVDESDVRLKEDIKRIKRAM